MKSFKKYILFYLIIIFIFSFQSSVFCAESFISFTSNNLSDKLNTNIWDLPFQEKTSTSSCGCSKDFTWGEPLTTPVLSASFQQNSLPSNWIMNPTAIDDNLVFQSSYNTNFYLNSIPAKINFSFTNNFNNFSFSSSFNFEKIDTNADDKSIDNDMVEQVADKAVIDWELLNPAGERQIEPKEIAARITTLENKTVALFWNSKPNGNLFLDRIAELLTDQVKNIRVIKLWEVMSSMETTTTNLLSSEQLEEIAQLSPDLVIASQCD